MTTRSRHHRADVLLPAKRDTGVRVSQSLGSQRVAAVVASSIEDSRDGKKVFLFWLVRRDDAWRIHKSDTAERIVVEERLRGFIEAGDVRWHVQRGELLGDWVAGPGTPPTGGGIACGNRLQLSDDNSYRLVAWGPAGPDPESDDAVQGTWRLAADRIFLTHKGQTDSCRVTWMADKLLVIEPLDGKGIAEYERTGEAQGQSAAGEGKLDSSQGER